MSDEFSIPFNGPRRRLFEAIREMMELTSWEDFSGYDRDAYRRLGTGLRVGNTVVRKDERTILEKTPQGFSDLQFFSRWTLLQSPALPWSYDLEEWSIDDKIFQECMSALDFKIKEATAIIRDFNEALKFPQIGDLGATAGLCQMTLGKIEDDRIAKIKDTYSIVIDAADEQHDKYETDSLNGEAYIARQLEDPGHWYDRLADTLDRLVKPYRPEELPSDPAGKLRRHKTDWDKKLQQISYELGSVTVKVGGVAATASTEAESTSEVEEPTTSDVSSLWHNWHYKYPDVMANDTLVNEIDPEELALLKEGGFFLYVDGVSDVDCLGSQHRIYASDDIQEAFGQMDKNASHLRWKGSIATDMRFMVATGDPDEHDWEPYQNESSCFWNETMVGHAGHLGDAWKYRDFAAEYSGRYAFISCNHPTERTSNIFVGTQGIPLYLVDAEYAERDDAENERRVVITESKRAAHLIAAKSADLWVAEYNDDGMMETTAVRPEVIEIGKNGLVSIPFEMSDPAYSMHLPCLLMGGIEVRPLRVDGWSKETVAPKISDWSERIGEFDEYWGQVEAKAEMLTAPKSDGPLQFDGPGARRDIFENADKANVVLQTMIDEILAAAGDDTDPVGRWAALLYFCQNRQTRALELKKEMESAGIVSAPQPAPTTAAAPAAKSPGNVPPNNTVVKWLKAIDGTEPEWEGSRLTSNNEVWGGQKRVCQIIARLREENGYRTLQWERPATATEQREKSPEIEDAWLTVLNQQAKRLLAEAGKDSP